MSEQQTDNTSTGLRKILFDTLRGLKDKTVDIEQAKAISDVSQTIINSVRAEIDFAKTTGLNPESEFIKALPPPKDNGISHPKPGHTVHRMK